jgi:hypothetical protein
VDQDPLFVDPQRGDFHRKAGAPALGMGAGDSTLVRQRYELSSCLLFRR